MSVNPFTVKKKYYSKMIERYEKMLKEAEEDEERYEELELMKELEFREKLEEVQLKMDRLRKKSERHGADGTQTVVRGNDEDGESDGEDTQGNEQQSTPARSPRNQEGAGQQATHRVKTDNRRHKTQTASDHFGAPRNDRESHAGLDGLGHEAFNASLDKEYASYSLNAGRQVQRERRTDDNFQGDDEQLPRRPTISPLSAVESEKDTMHPSNHQAA
ncbi:hypothetical protein AC578_9479 [Pseudocercospora eumusae]|uniref:Uncharacterized protein n=1 Tax=Pseudocercospora eumusae TaxID=321146 RepID=A0A139GXN7_9PEZI|nr:hypothetical protein AC578_9479 [Pseudocercospora eumusae]